MQFHNHYDKHLIKAYSRCIYPPQSESLEVLHQRFSHGVHEYARGK